MTEFDGAGRRTRLGAYAWCEDGDRVLLCRLGPGEMAPGQWTLPGGGVEFGEDPATGVLRELAEETGLTGRITGLVGIRSAVLEPHETIRGHRLHVVSALYRVTTTGGELRDEADGSSDRAAWIPFGELDALPSVPLLRWARDQVGR
jgi:ADP-ribose pyrophosphatase YjhB (NUDIX family)